MIVRTRLTKNFARKNLVKRLQWSVRFLIGKGLSDGRSCRWRPSRCRMFGKKWSRGVHTSVLSHVTVRVHQKLNYRVVDAILDRVIISVLMDRELTQAAGHQAANQGRTLTKPRSTAFSFYLFANEITAANCCRHRRRHSTGCRGILRVDETTYGETIAVLGRRRRWPR